MKRALITGVTGQDGSYLAELLLGKGYEVHGVIRRASTFNTGRIDHLYRDPHEPGTRFFTHYGDLSDSVVLTRLVHEVAPDEVYHLGAQSHVRVSFEIPEYTHDISGLGTLRLLEAIRDSGPIKATCGLVRRSFTRRGLELASLGIDKEKDRTNHSPGREPAPEREEQR